MRNLIIRAFTKPIVGLPVFFFMSIAAGLIAYFVWKLPLSQAYPDFVVGTVTWSAETKIVDYYAALTFFFCFPLLLLLANALLHHLAIRPKCARFVNLCRSNSISPGLTVFIAGAIQLEWWIALRMVNDGSSYDYLALSCILTLFLYVTLRSERGMLLGEPFRESFLIGMFALFFSYSTGLALAVAATRLLAPSHTVTNIARMLPWSFPLILASASICKATCEPVSLRQILKSILPWIQLPLPLLLLVFLPPEGIRLTRLPLLFLVATLLTTFALMWHRWWQKTSIIKDRQNPADLICPSALLCFILFEHASGYRASLFLGDDYHIGEWLLPWQQLASFGSIPFVDLNYPHGFIHLLQGLLNHVFFEGTLQTFPLADSLLKAIAVAATFTSLRLIIGTQASAVITLAFSTMACRHTFWFVAPAFATLANPRLLTKLPTWLAAWALLSCFLVLNEMSSGTAFLLSTLPVALWVIVKGIIEGQLKKWIAIGMLTTILLALVLFWEFFSGVILFLKENSKVNTIANGISWRASTFGFIGLLTFIAFAVIIYLVWHYAANLQENMKLSGPVTFGLMVSLFLVSITPYSLGRIDQEVFTRSSMTSGWAILFALPVMVLLARRKMHNPLLLLLAYIGLFAAIRSVVSGSIFPPLTSQIQKAAPFPVNMSVQGYPRNSKEDLVRMGKMLMLQKGIKSALLPGETYLDLTNRSALYYYFGYRVPTLEAAYYNAPSTETQFRILRKLQLDPPPLVLAKADNIIHDGLYPALRSNLLYRFVLLSYVPVRFGSTIFMVKPERADWFSSTHSNTESRWELIDEAFGIRQLGKVPQAWGRSWKSLLPQLKRGHEFHQENEIQFGLRNAIRGSEAGFLVFQADYKGAPGSPHLEADIFWDGDGSGKLHSNNSLGLFVTEGMHIVPIDVSPRWLLADKITRVWIRLKDAKQCRSFTISEVALYQRQFNNFSRTH